MAYFNGTWISTGVESPIEKYLEFRKWQFQTWNKDEQKNEVHPMDNFVVIDLWYTIKWKLWSDIEQKNILSVYSNEIKHFWQKLTVTEVSFLDKEKRIIAEWTWKDIKNILPTYAKLNLAVIVLDLNDMWIKEFFLSGRNFYDVSNFILKKSEPWDILSIKVKIMYTNWIKDKNWDEILVDENYINSLKGIEASKYKNRYVLNIENTWNKFEDKEFLNQQAEILDEYFKNKYWTWEIKEEEIKSDINDKMYKPTKEQLWLNDAEEVFWNTMKKDKIENIYNVPF